MRSIFLDDEAIEDDSESEPTFTDSELGVRSINQEEIAGGTSPYKRTLHGNLNDGIDSSKTGRSLTAPYSPASSSYGSLATEDRFNIDRDLNLLTCGRSDDGTMDEEEEEDGEYDEDLADFIVSDSYIEPESDATDPITGGCLEAASSTVSSSGDSVLEAGGTGRLKRLRRASKRLTKKRRSNSSLPPHPRFAFSPSGEPQVTVDSGSLACQACAQRQAAKRRLAVVRAVAVRLEPAASAGRSEERKTNPAPSAPCLSPRPLKHARGGDAPSGSSAPLDYMELMKVAAYQSLTVNVPDGFGGDFEVIPSEQWGNLEGEGDTEYNNIVYVRGSSRRKGRDDFLVLSSSSSESKQRPIKLGRKVVDVSARQVITEIIMIPIRDIELALKSLPETGTQAHENAAPPPSVPEKDKCRPSARVYPQSKKIDACKVLVSATKLRREHRWQLRFGRRLRLFQRIMRLKNEPLMEVAREAGYTYLHGPASALPSSLPPLPNPVFPSRDTLRRLLRPLAPGNNSIGA
eukprot:Gregarina_sp_Pseudo_9__3887@NODE_402_length_2918_cov_31_833623_g379_i0_p1_GENE_NODE_402_length_2918_cov_31_833623_g379_i0NODE_402_length_2918_cov_31_833623_g379_i0_p1_ORF_typecomplete_len518_score72_98Spt5_N/PF11942_8/1_6e02Spt5_N/PF11942_8/0_35_NODE_402_length_2918_cov_31_833623_g379_i05552108